MTLYFNQYHDNLSCIENTLARRINAACVVDYQPCSLGRAHSWANFTKLKSEYLGKQANNKGIYTAPVHWQYTWYPAHCYDLRVTYE